MNAQIKSKERVKDRGEVFTASREVEAMLDLIPSEEFSNPHSTWLEPGCGNGNFIMAILVRKMAHCPTDSNRNIYALKVISSLYGVDIAADNVSEAIERLIAWTADNVSNDPIFLSEVYTILKRNIVVANFLNMGQIPYAEYTWKDDEYVCS